LCISCGVCGGDPVPAPTPDCTLEDDDKLMLTTQNKKLTCARIEKKKLCDDEVENQEDKTAADLCISCGVCGGDPVPAPTPSPPDEDKCKGANDTLKLKKKGDKTCAAIKEKGLCKEKVKKADGKKKKASDFCASCGCGGGGSDD